MIRLNSIYVVIRALALSQQINDVTVKKYNDSRYKMDLRTQVS